MTLWLILTLMMVFAAVLIAAPFLKQNSAQIEGGRQDIALYREQLRELESEVARGAVTESDAAETRREIERRVLATAKRQESGVMHETSDRGRIIGLALTTGWLVVGSVGLYAAIGRPDLADSPRSTMAPALPQLGGPEMSLMPSQGSIVASAPTPMTDNKFGDVNSMIARLAERVEREPDDLGGWQMLAWSYLKTNNLDGAVRAYGKAVELAPENAELLSLYGETMVRSNGGVVTDAAQAVFARSLAHAPDNPRARFFEGMALEQAGNGSAALEIWLEILKSGPEGADWRPGLLIRIREIAAATGYDLSGIAGLDGGAQPLGNPSAADIVAAQQMSDEERRAMIQGMIDRLAARLAGEPNDPDGWARLIRSYSAVGDNAAATEALSSARVALRGNASGLAQIDRAAAEAGLK